MATIEPSVIQELLEQIKALEYDIRTGGDVRRSMLASIDVTTVRNRIPQAPAGGIDNAGWIALPAPTQNELLSQLTHIRDSLQAITVSDGPADPKHIMSATYASNLAIVVWALIGFLITALLLWQIQKRWDQATGTDRALAIETATVEIGKMETAEKEDAEAKAKVVETNAQETAALRKAEEAAKTKAQQLAVAQERAIAAVKEIKSSRGGATEARVLMMIILLGALGGSIHMVASLVKYVGNRQLRRSWLLHYLSMPIVGGALATIVYMLLRVGILNPSGEGGTGSAIVNLNLIAIYAFAALTGMFAKIASEKLAEVFGTLFRSTAPPAKDSIGSEKPPGSA